MNFTLGFRRRISFSTARFGLRVLKRRTAMKKTPILAALALLTLLSACGTVQGVASDTYGATKFVVRQLTDD